MININNYILEKLKINSKTKINNSNYVKLPKNEYTLSEISKIIDKREQQFGPYTLHGYEIAYRYLNKYFNNSNTKFYLIRSYELQEYNYNLYNDIIENNYFLRSSKKLEKIGWYEVEDDQTEDIYTKIINKDNHLIFWFGLLDKIPDDYYLKYIIIEKRTFEKL